jgi:energy-coupling factor transporter ATP-binding protein EcfA2
MTNDEMQTETEPPIQSPPRLERLRIEKLFGIYTHEIDFPLPATSGSQPSLLILHGVNGIGKTTVLTMLAGMMELDFTAFRRIPFQAVELSFADGTSLSCRPQRKEAKLEYLLVRFRDFTARLHPLKAGPYTPEDGDQVETLRKNFLEHTRAIHLELIRTDRRFPYPDYRFVESDPSTERILRMSDGTLVRLETDGTFTGSEVRGKRHRNVSTNLAKKIIRFIRDAQADHRAFFMTSEPDLFGRIMIRISSEVEANSEDLLLRLARVTDAEKRYERFAFAPADWNFEELRDTFNKHLGSPHATSVLAAYVDMLEAKSRERELLARRLTTFETIMEEFFVDKRVRVHPGDGLSIRSASGAELHENALSSGEFQLLYLMVAALTTQVRGTILAIDEPELSLHLSWQRKLISALFRCAEWAAPLFLLATHSPDVAGEYTSSMKRLGGRDEQLEMRV